jgi:hypothetical protein
MIKYNKILVWQIQSKYSSLQLLVQLKSKFVEIIKWLSKILNFVAIYQATWQQEDMLVSDWSNTINIFLSNYWANYNSTLKRILYRRSHTNISHCVAICQPTSTPEEIQVSYRSNTKTKDLSIYITGIHISRKVTLTLLGHLEQNFQNLFVFRDQCCTHWFSYL